MPRFGRFIDAQKRVRIGADIELLGISCEKINLPADIGRISEIAELTRAWREIEHFEGQGGAAENSATGSAADDKQFHSRAFELRGLFFQHSVGVFELILNCAAFNRRLAEHAAIAQSWQCARG